MCLINVAHECSITQAGKKTKPALINFMGPRGLGPGIDILHWSIVCSSISSQKQTPVTLPMLRLE